VFGSSRQLIVGPEGSIAAMVAAMVAAAVVPLAADDPQRAAGLASLLALLVGAAYLVARLIRLGWVADYFSQAVLLGYLHGLSLAVLLVLRWRLRRFPVRWSWSWPRSSSRPPSTWPPTGSPWSAASPRACRPSRSPTPAWATA
jgi:Sulfate permease family